MRETASLIVGAGGLLGSALRRQLPQATCAQVRWGTREANDDLARALADATARAHGGDLTVYWCAGAGVTGTSQEQLDEELACFTHFLNDVAKVAGGLTFFLASSAGGVYGGSDHPPFTENHRSKPLAPYGHTKLAMERAAYAKFKNTGVKLAIGRIANLYGPGQNLNKMQGLISHLCKTLVTGQPLGLYVPIDTIRDYIYVDDCAKLVVRFADAVTRGSEPVVMKILASGRGVTIGELIGVTKTVIKRRPDVIYAASKLAAAQSSDLRLRSVVMPELDSCVQTTLPAGIAATAESILDLFRAGQLQR